MPIPQKTENSAIFWENAHKFGLNENWLNTKEKLPFLLKAINLVRREHNVSKTSPLKALDIGCSIGNYSSVLAQKGFEVIGIDVSQTAIKTALRKAREQKKTGINFLQGDFLNAALESGAFDIILDFSVLTHTKLARHEAYLIKLHRILKSGGILILSLWSKNSTGVHGLNPSLLDKQEVRIITPYGTFYDIFFTEEEIKNIFGKYFDIIKLKECTLSLFKKARIGRDLKLFFLIAGKSFNVRMLHKSGT